MSCKDIGMLVKIANYVSSLLMPQFSFYQNVCFYEQSINIILFFIICIIYLHHFSVKSLSMMGELMLCILSLSVRQGIQSSILPGSAGCRVLIGCRGRHLLRL